MLRLSLKNLQSLFLTVSLIAYLSATPTRAAHISFSIPPTPLLPNPSTLPPTTRATLYRLNSTISAPLSQSNSFVFSDVKAGSHLFTVQCRDYTFGPLRVDVTPVTASSGLGAATSDPASVSETGASSGSAKEKIEVWQTFWGNEWGNKGERKAAGVGKVDVLVPAERRKEYYSSRQGFDPISFLKSPMILMAIAALALIVGLPYLTENMDEETRAEFEAMQKSSPLSQAASGAQGGLSNFDLAGYLAGSPKASSSTSGGDERTAGKKKN